MDIIFILIFIYNIYRSYKKAQDIICKKPNDFWSIIAPPGTGKTCLASYFVRNALKENKTVYSNKPIRHALQIDIKEDFGKYNIHDAIIIIDEAGSDLNNRNWYNNLTKESVEFIKLHRHYNVDIYCFSQAPNDMDNKFRDLVTRLYLLEKSRIPFYVFARSLFKVMKLEGGQIVQYLEEDTSTSFKFFTPNTWAYFNSWDKHMILKEKEKKYYTILDLN